MDGWRASRSQLLLADEEEKVNAWSELSVDEREANKK